MARSRNIKPSIMDNEELAELSPIHRLLFIYLWMLADREGRLEDRPKRIAAQALAYDRDADVNQILDDLSSSGFILRYKADGVEIIQILAFEKHQNPHVREAASELPAPKQGTTKARIKHNQGSAKASPRSPDSLSLIPDSGFSDTNTKPAAQGLFDAFWKKYPKKVGKDAAKKEFDKRAPDDALLSVMLAAIDWQGKTEKWTKDDGQFVPNPATWLNEGRWQDEQPQSCVESSRDSRQAIEAEAEAKGLGKWNELEQFGIYRERVRNTPAGLLDSLRKPQQVAA